ncbi:unnamed protein product [Auanema sp. JU1783]|nr:unnamed protein product [Auanema sp. JU1783]
MRGVPGSGKSYTARKLKDLSSDAKIFSTDDYFYDRDHQYKWDAALLDDYHKKNVARVRDAIKNCTKLVIVDNTNISVDDMRQYVHHAVVNFYEIYVVEAESEWRNKASVCAKKNIHGVTKDRIVMMLDKMSTERDITLQVLVGKNVQIKLNLDYNCGEGDYDDKIELSHPPEYPKPISFAPPPGLTIPGISAGISFASTPKMENILSSIPSPVITLSPKVTTPEPVKSFLSLSLPVVEPTKREVVQRTVQTQLKEVMIPLAEAGVLCHTTEFEIIEETSKVYERYTEVECKDRPAPGKSDAEELVPTDDMDLLVCLFPFEDPEDLKHYYDNVGLNMTIALFHETGNTYANHEAFVIKGAYQPHEEVREHMTKSYRIERDEFEQLSASDDVKVQIKISDLKTILSILFGTGDGTDIPETLTVNISVLLQLYKQSKDNLVEEFSNLELDEMLARKLDEENAAPMSTQNRITMAQRIQYLKLVQEFPMVDNMALFQLFMDNGYNSDFTRTILTAEFDPKPLVDLQPTQQKTLQRKVITRRDSLRTAQLRAKDLFERANELYVSGQAQLIKGQAAPKHGGTFYRAEGFDYLKEVNRLRNEANLILKEANLRCDVMDFHKMTVSCALDTLKEKLRQYDRTIVASDFKSKKKITVITGAGKTEGSKGAIKAEVVKYLKMEKYYFHQENEGQLTIYCK